MTTRLPGPRSPIAKIGLARKLNADARSTLLEMVETYGPVVEFGAGKYRYVYLLSPEANEYVLTTDPSNFTWRDAFQVLVPVNGETALVVSDGDDHTRRRRIVQPAFHMRRISSYLKVMVDETNLVLDQWREGDVVDAHAELRLAIRRIVLRCLFGDALRKRDRELSADLEVALAYVNRPPTQRIDRNIPGLPYRKAIAARRAVDAIVFEEITRRRGLDDRGDDIISWLITDQETGDGLDDQEVRDQIISLIAAGYDTTASAMGWAAAELAAAPDRAALIRSEVLEASGGQSLTIEHTSQLTYTNAFIQEVLRLHPPAIWSGRRVVDSFEIHGKTIPSGAMILFSPHVTHRDADSFRDPNEFRPERWIEGHADRDEPHPYAHVPFGGGPRRCLGFAFATQELIAITALLALRTQIEPAGSGPQRHVGTMSSAPEGGARIRVLATPGQPSPPVG